MAPGKTRMRAKLRPSPSSTLSHTSPFDAHPAQAAMSLGLLSSEEFDAWVRPETMIAPVDK